MTSNNAESVNRVLKDGREYPVLVLLGEIRQFMCRWFAERRQKSNAWVDLAPPNIEEKIQKRFVECSDYFVYVMDANVLQFEVRKGEEREIVCLELRCCTCHEFDIEEIPCIHAIAAAKRVNQNPSSLIGKYYTCENWKVGYVETIYPVPNKSEWNVPLETAMLACDPPKRRKRTGRMTKARIKASWEKDRKRKCSCCGIVGHNKKTCTNQPK